MFTVIQKNRKTDAILSTTSFPTQELADKFSVRCALADSNPNMIYTVE